MLFVGGRGRIKHFNQKPGHFHHPNSEGGGGSGKKFGRSAKGGQPLKYLGNQEKKGKVRSELKRPEQILKARKQKKLKQKQKQRGRPKNKRKR